MEARFRTGAIFTDTAALPATTTLPGQKTNDPSPRPPAVELATVAKPPSGSLVNNPAIDQDHAAGSTPLTSPEVDPAKDPSPLSSREDAAAQYSTPSTSPEVGPAPRANRKAGSPSVPVELCENDINTKPLHSTSCATPYLSSLPEPSDPIIICAGPSRRHVRNMVRMPNPPLDLATAHNRDDLPAPGAREPVLSAKQVETGQPTIPHGDFRTVPDEFWKYPPPEMHESNQEFDETYLKATPASGFDMAVVEKYISRYAEETTAFAETMEEHQDQYDTWQNVIACKKEELEKLEETRERIIRDSRRLKSILPASIPREYLGRVQTAEDTLMMGLGEAQREVRQNIIRGNAMIADALRWDFDLPAAVGGVRTMKLEKKAAEEAEMDVLAAAATIGTRLGEEDQDGPTSAIVQQFIQATINEKAKLTTHSNPDVKGKTEPTALPVHTPFKGLSLIAHGIFTTVPEWFTILDGKGIIELRGPSSMERFEELITTIGQPPADSSEKRKETPPERPFDKEYHEPNRAWPLPKWRIRGGWWKCRSGPEASPAERRCKLCHPTPSGRKPDSAAAKPATLAPTPIRPTDAEMRKRVMEEIEKAMAEAHKRDNVRLKMRLQEEQEEKERLHQQQEWRRLGGGFLPHELLYGRQVNDVNYTSWERSARSSLESVYRSQPGLQRLGPQSIGKGKGKSVSWQL
ncbi:hypothetical protein MMYC01_203632 [Madurella mycetomatis]|uniref:Uncharacterized protein n=1 Tax=Madurella mycetomatis TaxID=100816 RepID=A0A175W9L5_9PEZI|nr:hypothetical protein MMYC01_203632 [Madurella mycetomatis]